MGPSTAGSQRCLVGDQHITYLEAPHTCVLQTLFGGGGVWVPPSHFPVGLEPRQHLLCGCGEVRPGGEVEERGQSPGLLFGAGP